MLEAADWAWFNNQIWPAQLFAYAVGAAAVGLVFAHFPKRNLVITGLVSLFWFGEMIWVLILVNSLDPITLSIAGFLIVAFLAQAILMLVSAAKGRIHFGFSGRAQSWVGLVFVGYAMIGYPIATWLLGHPFPRGPVFGVAPCPIVIFTLGMLLLTDSHLPKHLVILPTVLGVIAGLNGLMLGVREDLPLFVAVPLGAWLIWRRPAIPKASVSRSVA